jgi:hypothetical protein
MSRPAITRCLGIEPRHVIPTLGPCQNGQILGRRRSPARPVRRGFQDGRLKPKGDSAAAEALGTSADEIRAWRRGEKQMAFAG